MADSYAVKTVFRGTDKISPVFKQMSGNAAKFGNRAEASFKKASRSALSFKTLVGGILTAGIVQRGFGLMSMGVRSATEELVSFDDAITRAAAKFGGIERGSEDFKKIQQAARLTGKMTKFTATEAAEGLDFLALAGFSAQQAIAALPGTVQLATAGSIELSEATQMAADTLGAFRLRSENAAELATNLTRVNDVLAKTSTTATTDIRQLYEAIGKGGPAVAGAGASIETFASLTGVLANSSIKASEAGTALRNIFLRLTAKSGPAAKEIKRLGINVEDASGNFRDILDILDDVRRGTADMGTAQRSASLDLIFGKRAISAVNVLLGQSDQALRDYRKVIEEAGGASAKMAEDIEKSLGNRLMALKSAAVETGLKFFDAFDKQIPEALNTAIEAVRGFSIGSVIDSIKDFISLVGKVIEVVKALEPAIWGVVAAFAAWRGYLLAIMAIEAVRYVITLIKWFRGLTVTIGLLNLVSGFWPTIIVIGIGLIVAGIIYCIKYWDEIKAVAIDVFVSIVNGVLDAAKWVVEFGRSIAKTFGISTESIDKFIEKIEGAKRKTAEMKKIVIPVTDEELFGPGMTMLPEFGGETVAPRQPPREAPNEGFMEKLQSSINFEGVMSFVNPPPGAEISSKTTGAPPIRMDLIGANP